MVRAVGLFEPLVRRGLPAGVALGAGAHAALAGGAAFGWWRATAPMALLLRVQSVVFVVLALALALRPQRLRGRAPVALLLALCLVAGAATASFGTFSASTSAIHAANTNLSAPSNLVCKWAGMANVRLDWTAATSGTGYDIQRSTTAGSGHASIGTNTGLSNVSYSDTTANPPTATPLAAYYFIVKTMAGSWRSTATNEKDSTTCPGYLTTHVGSAGTHASSPTTVAMQPNRIAISGTTMYVSDQMSIVRAINMSTGAVTVVAGNLGPGFYGDGGPGDLANVNQPYGVAVDSAGNRYVGDFLSRRIRKITSGGTISTVGGNGQSASLSSPVCWNRTDGCGDGGQATSAIIREPLGVAVDSVDHVWFVDTDLCRVRRIDASTGVITTVVGNGTCGFAGDAGAASSANLNFPRDLAFAGDGDLYIADTSNKRIRKVEAGVDGIIQGTDIISTVAGTGTAGKYGGGGAAAASAQLGGPSSVYLAGSVVLIPDPGQNRIRTVNAGNAGIYAGTGTAGTSGDYGHRWVARFNGPRYVVDDSLGNVYVSDTGNHCVRVIWGTDGSIGPYAGTCGTSGTGADNVLATSSPLSGPRGLAIDDEGSLYIADTGNNKIRKVTRTGQITTFAGTGAAANTGDGGNATAATLNGPYDVAWDSTNSGRLLIADTGNNRIRRVATNSGNAPGVITNIAGTGAANNTGDGGSATAATLSGPKGIHWLDNNNIYIADTGNNRVRVFAAAGNIVNFAGSSAGTAGDAGDDGVPTNATLNAPEDVYAVSTTSVYIADTGNGRVRHYNGTNIVAFFSAQGDTSAPAFAGDGGAATSGNLNNPVGIAISGTDVYVADDGDDRIRKFTVGGNISTFAGDGTTSGDIGDAGAATAARLTDPVDVAVSGADVYIAEGGGYRVRKVTSGNISTYAGNGTPAYSGDTGATSSAQLNEVTGVAISSNDRYLYLSDPVNHKVRSVDHGSPLSNPDTINQTVNQTSPSYAAGTTAQVVGDGGAATSAPMSDVSDIVRDTNGSVYVVERANNRIRKIAITGEVSTFAGTGAAGNTGDGGQASAAQLNAPDGIALDSANNVYIADTGNHCVRKVTVSTGVITTYAGLCGTSGNANGSTANARFTSPRGLLIDEDGLFYVADTGNHVVRSISAGTVATYAGTPGTANNTGDSGQATLATLNAPRRLARNPGGNFTFIADTGNHRIRRVAASGVISAYAGTGTQGSTDGNATSTATFSGPRGISWDDQNSDLYIADTGNHRIRRVNGANTELVAGSTSGDAGDGIAANDASVKLTSPEGVFVRYWTGDVATSGWPELLIADTGNHRVKRIDINATPNPWLTRFAGTAGAGSYAGDSGVFTSAHLTSPAGLAYNGSSLYIADQSDRRIRQTHSTFFIRTVAGDSVNCSPTTASCGDGGLAVNAQFADPIDIAFDASGNMFIADGTGARVRRVYAGVDAVVNGGSDETISTVAGTGTSSSTGDTGPATSATINYPSGLAFFGNDLYIAERNGSQIRKVTAGADGLVDGDSDDVISTVAGTGTASSTGDGGAATWATINWPTDVAFDASGNMYIAERKGCRVRKVISGTISTLYGGTCGAAGDQGGAPGAYGHPTRLALDSTGNLYVAEGLDGGVFFPPGHRVRKIYEADSWTP